MDGDFIFAAIYSVETMAIYKYDHHFTTFLYKNIVQGFLMYNEFAPKHYKGK